jgi:hypothetical protein
MESGTITKPLGIGRALRKPTPLHLKPDKENMAEESQRVGMMPKPSLKSKNPVRRVLIGRRVPQIVEPVNPLKARRVRPLPTDTNMVRKPLRGGGG